MALDAEEQELFDVAVATLPAWYTSDERQREELAGAAKMFGATLATVRYWFSQALIGQANGPVTGLPDWLAQHADDRGTYRQANETTPALRDRLRRVPDAVTPPSLLASVAAILAADSIVGTAVIVELPEHGAHAGAFVAMTGTGGAFTQVGTVSTFTPTVLPWPAPPFQHVGLLPALTHELVISGAANGGNNGTRTITTLVDDGAVVSNAGGVAAVDPTVTWTVQRLDPEGNVRDGFSRAYSQRGYRSAGRRPWCLIVILPYGSTSGTESGVLEMLRQKKASGVVRKVERRLIAP